MSDLISLVQHLRRPRLLLAAARHGLKDYNREHGLKRLALNGRASPQKAVETLLATEETLEHSRCIGDASYAPSRHVEVLIALLAEIRALAQPRVQS